MRVHTQLAPRLAHVFLYGLPDLDPLPVIAGDGGVWATIRSQWAALPQSKRLQVGAVASLMVVVIAFGMRTRRRPRERRAWNPYDAPPYPY